MTTYAKVNANRIRAHIKAVSECYTFETFKIVQLNFLSNLVDQFEKDHERIQNECRSLIGENGDDEASR